MNETNLLTLKALQDRLGKERKGFVRREILNTNPPLKAGLVDRSLARLIQSEDITRVGCGIYAIGNARLAEVVPEIMPVLGFEIENLKVKGYSQYLGGNSWYIDRPSVRFIRRNGVMANFIHNHKPILGQWRSTMTTGKMPTMQEIQDHFHIYTYCQSLARAEKDLLVMQALDVFETFKDSRCTLGLNGGTAMAYYYRITDRFSEGIDTHILLNEAENALPKEQQINFLKDVGRKFVEHVQQQLPFLRLTNKGRVKANGEIQTFVFHYDPTYVDERVQHGIKFDVGHHNGAHSFSKGSRYSEVERTISLVNILDLSVGKIHGLKWTVGKQPRDPERLRHVYDLAAVYAHTGQLGTNEEWLKSLRQRNITTMLLQDIVNEFQDSSWEVHYLDYIDRMGKFPVGDRVLQAHPTWRAVLQRFTRFMSDKAQLLSQG